MIFDLVLVGGGLQNALVALALLDRAPSARVALVEAAPRLAGNHTWSFHAGDLAPAMARAVAPLVVHRWPAYEVAFPGLARRFDRPYASITSERLHDVVVERLAAARGGSLLLGARAARVTRDTVHLDGGEVLRGAAVVDARGPGAMARGACAYQAFLGLEVDLDRAHGLEVPLVMDARVAQDEGFRFVYVLPLAPRRALVEDTSYQERPGLDRAQATRRVRAYLAALGLGVARVLREEVGALPLPLAAPPRRQGAAGRAPGAILGGYAGGWFHPTTGYSLPAAARLAGAVAEAWPDPPSPAALARLGAAHDAQVRFSARLNWLLFHAFAPEERWRVLERFHRLPADTIERFYAMRTTAADRARILLGRPPRGISLRRALDELLVPGGQP